VLIQVLYMSIRDEQTGEYSPRDLSSIPALTVNQTKVFALLFLLERNELFAGFVDKFEKFTRYRMIGGMKSLNKLKTWQLVNLTRVLVTIWKFKGNILRFSLMPQKRCYFYIAKTQGINFETCFVQKSSKFGFSYFDLRNFHNLFSLCCSNCTRVRIIPIKLGV